MGNKYVLCMKVGKDIDYLGLNISWKKIKVLFSRGFRSFFIGLFYTDEIAKAIIIKEGTILHSSLQKTKSNLEEKGEGLLFFIEVDVRYYNGEKHIVRLDA